MGETNTLPAPVQAAVSQVYEPIPIDAVLRQVGAIQQLMKSVMKQDEHYGVIPGTGSKPSLLQPGAQKLCLSFQLAPMVQTELRHDLPGGHREYETTVRLIHRPTNAVVADGVGVCSTMESRYRYRNENTGREVPREYWRDRDQAILGGPGFTTKKVKGKWLISHRVEHDSPADYYNTVRKMAFKRALVAACVNGLAASDIFTQDVEDIREGHEGHEDHDEPAMAASAPAPAPAKDEIAEMTAKIRGVLQEAKVPTELWAETIAKACEKYRWTMDQIKARKLNLDQLRAAYGCVKRHISQGSALPPAEESAPEPEASYDDAERAAIQAEAQAELDRHAEGVF